MKQEVIALFEGASDASLTAYILDSFIDNQYLGSRPAVIICPGGAYLGLSEKEAEPVAIRFLSAGYPAFVLRYSIGAGVARFPAPFVDAAKAISIVRENSNRWGIDPDRIILCGFSTGGHVASIFATTWQQEYLAKALNADNQLFKPNALVLGYPLLDLHHFKKKSQEKSMEMNTLLEMIFHAVYGTTNPDQSTLDEWCCKNRVTSNMPPTFIWGTREDAFSDPEQILDFSKALTIHQVPYELHVFEKGAHGLSLGDTTVGYSEIDMKVSGNTGKWVDLALNWLQNRL